MSYHILHYFDICYLKSVYTGTMCKQFHLWLNRTTENYVVMMNNDCYWLLVDCTQCWVLQFGGAESWVSSQGPTTQEDELDARRHFPFHACVSARQASWGRSWKPCQDVCWSPSWRCSQEPHAAVRVGRRSTREGIRSLGMIITFCFCFYNIWYYLRYHYHHLLFTYYFWLLWSNII